MPKSLTINAKTPVKHKTKKSHAKKAVKKPSRKVTKNDLAQAKAKAAQAKSKSEKEVIPYELRYTVARNKLGSMGKFISENELHKMIDMDTSISNIHNRLRQRIMVSVVILVIGLIACVFAKKQAPYILMGTPILIGLIWFMQIKQTNIYYSNWQLERQLAFAQFTRLAAAYLPELAKGANLYSVFQKMLPRMKNDKDHTALEDLMINMQVNPNDSKPFTDFAHKFSASDSAELIMLTIHQMYLGDVSDKNIRVLADDANKDMMRQIDGVINIKIQKFYQIATRIAMLSMLVVFGFLLSMVYFEFKKSFNLASQANVK